MNKREKSSIDSKDSSLNSKTELLQDQGVTAGYTPVQGAFTSAFKKLKIGNRVTLIDEKDIKYFEENERNFKGSSVFFKMTNNFYKSKEAQSQSNEGFTSTNPRNPF